MNCVLGAEKFISSKEKLLARVIFCFPRLCARDEYVDNDDNDDDDVQRLQGLCISNSLYAWVAGRHKALAYCRYHRSL